MTRDEILCRHFVRTMRLIEIGPSTNPIVPKSDGWQTTVVDHASQKDLQDKYRRMGVVRLDQIEPVDFIWQDGSLTELLPPELHGTFDGLVASHVGEHFPDLIAFFKDASVLLKSDGVMALALPDKRVCFDIFQPMTMTGDVVAAHLERRTRHPRRAFFNQAAYYATRADECGWPHEGNSTPLQLANHLAAAQLIYDSVDDGPDSEYSDTHAWVLTPKSFELLILELNLLGHIDWAIRAIEPAAGVEFYVWLERNRIVMPEAQVNPARLSLLTAMIYEMQSVIDEIDGNATKQTAPVMLSSAAIPMAEPALGADATIAVIIPLYNGAGFIGQTLSSVFKQTMPATEIIIVDDGSTDGGAGAAIVEGLMRERPLTLLRRANGGQSAARNLGVRHARSDLIAFLDQDDIWYESHLEELVKPFQSRSAPPLGWVYSDLDEIDEAGHLVCRSFLSSMKVVHPKRNIFDCIGQDMFILPSASLVRRSAFNAVGGFDERLCGYEDDDLFLRLFRLGYDNVFVERALSQWRIYPGSTSYSFRMTRSRGIYLRKLLNMFQDDVRRDRYYVRDHIVPRFLSHALHEYETSLTTQDAATVAAAWDEVTWLAQVNGQPPPRLLDHLLRRYKAALIQGDSARITSAWADLTAVAARMPARSRRLRAALTLLRNPIVSKSAFALRRLARPAMLWAFSA